MVELDYRKLDNERNIKFKREKLDIAQEHGYKYITEAIHKMYNEGGPKVAAETMQITENGVYQILKYMGVEVKQKKRGGVNNFKLNADIVIKARAMWDGRRDNVYIQAMMTVLNVDVSRNCFVSMLDGDTWSEVK